MTGRQSKVKLLAIAGLLVFSLFSGSCSPDEDFDARLGSIVEPYRFSLIGWESRAILQGAGQWFSDGPEEVDNEAHTVMEYFSSVERIKVLESEIEASTSDGDWGGIKLLEIELNEVQQKTGSLQGTVEGIIGKQIRETLTEQGIVNPLDKFIRLEFQFPPLSYRLEKPPYLLVVSPRDRIESIRKNSLRQDISLEEILDIESEVDKLGYSSLVVRPGGIATYPSLVTHDAGLSYIIDAVIEEWLHQYLFFKPLGFLYSLDLIGLSRNYEIVTINETLANMVSKELGSIVSSKYYPQYGNGVQAPQSGFDFNQEMREIRKTVDQYLTQGEIEKAEEFMEQKRQYLVSMGYNIRKLNQAYFAFHGTYADGPTSISPIGLALKELRSESASLKDFLDTVAAMTSRQDLGENIEQVVRQKPVSPHQGADFN